MTGQLRRQTYPQDQTSRQESICARRKFGLSIGYLYSADYSKFDAARIPCRQHFDGNFTLAQRLVPKKVRKREESANVENASTRKFHRKLRLIEECDHGECQTTRSCNLKIQWWQYCAKNGPVSIVRVVLTNSLIVVMPQTNPNIQTIPADILASLSKIDSCTLSNAIEQFKVRLRNEGFMNGTVKCQFPDFAPVTGYAVTGRIRTSSTPFSGRCYHESMEWWSYLLTVPSPRFIVLKDSDPIPGVGAFLARSTPILQKLSTVRRVFPMDRCGTCRELRTRVYRFLRGASQFRIPMRTSLNLESPSR